MARSTDFDVILVGSGINSLVCGALLARAGRRVCILERATVPGGCMVTEEATLPGFHHDMLAMSFPLFVSAPYYAELRDDLGEVGVTFLTGELPTGVLMPDGSSLVMSRSRKDNIRSLDRHAVGDGAAFDRAMTDLEQHAPLIFGLLGNEPFSFATARTLGHAALRLRARGISRLMAESLTSLRHWLEPTFASEQARALIAPWVLHAGLGPDDALSALMGQVIMASVEQAGVPVAKGGSYQVVRGFHAIITRAGGQIHTECDVARILIRNGQAAGVELADGRTLSSRHVVCNVTPTQLYGRLIPPEKVPLPLRGQTRRFRYGRSCMQIHLALDAPPNWADPALAQVGLLHLTPGLDGVSRAVNEATCGLLPHDATIVVGQPAFTDPTRCPPGRGLLWIQLQELPAHPRGDAAGVLDIPPQGWTPELAQAYARRIITRIARHAPGLEKQILGMRVLSPADLARRNINLVGGDPYSGACTLEQSYLWRPLPGLRNHETPIPGLYHIGAATHPGPGLGGMSGYMVGRLLS